MKILFVSFDEVPAFKGASTHILSGLRTAIKKHDVSLVTLGSIQLAPYCGFRHMPQFIPEKNFLLRAQIFRKRVRELVLELKPDLIHFRSPWEGLSFLDLKIPLLYEVNGLSSIEAPYSFPQISERHSQILRAQEKQCLQRADLVLSPSLQVFSYLKNNVSTLLATKFFHLPNAFDKAPLQMKSVSNLKLKMLYLGTLNPWQGLLWSLKAFIPYKNQIELDVYSQPHRLWNKLLKKRIARYGLEQCVQVKEPLNKIGLLRELPLYDYGFAPLLRNKRNITQGCCPIKILDYRGAGLPVIASDLFVCRELLKNEHDSLLFKANSRFELERTLKRIIENRSLSETLSLGVVDRNSEFLSWDDYSDRLCYLYESLFYKDENKLSASVQNSI